MKMVFDYGLISKLSFQLLVQFGSVSFKFLKISKMYSTYKIIEVTIMRSFVYMYMVISIIKSLYASHCPKSFKLL